ncbi:MAG TPA: PAS domain S-box protein, partial [Longimicrobium sp.]|nr:PAS domain S-box protein [Longimicrobium sp.]
LSGAARPQPPLLDSGAGEVFARIQRLASLALRAPVSTFTAADEGAEGDADPAAAFGEGDDAFCRRVWRTGAPVIIPDTKQEPRVVREYPGVRAYLGVPLRDPAGAVLGTLCVRDAVPRAWTGEDVELLQGLAGAAANELVLRRELAERRRAEEALRDSEERFNAFMDHSPVVAFVKDAAGRYIYVNAGFERHFHTTRAEAVGRTDAHYTTPDVAHTVAEMDAGLIAGGGSLQYLARRQSPDGREVVWQAFKFAFRTGGGERLVGGVALDVTERERADEALRESERRLNEAQRLARVGSWEWDLVADRGQWSDEHFRLLGVEPGTRPAGYELLLERIHPDDRAAHQAAVAAAIGGAGVLDSQYRVVHPDGTVLHLHSRGQVTFDGEGRAVRMHGTVQDVTEREAASAALRAGEERYRRIVEAAGDIIYEADPWGRFTYANPAALRILGYQTGDVLGRHYSELMRPDYHDRAAELYSRQVRERVPSTYFEFPAVARDGREIWIGQVVQLVVEDGRVRGLHAVARDISARHEVERLKNEFISVVSHELRTPLTSIRGSLGLLGSGKLGELSERAQRLVDIATQNSERLVRLINDILDIERIESGAISMERRTVQSGELVRQAVNAVRGMAERAGVGLETRVEEFDFNADPDRVVQVLTNLISNAVKFSAADAGAVVAVEARAAEGGARFRVIDRGRGIPEDKLDAIFERFQQVDSSDSRQKGGTGLGLAISRTIVQQHGGEIGVESSPGQGSTFTFTIPPPAPAAAAAPTPPAPAPSRASTQVLVGCADASARQALAEALAREGFLVRQAASATETVSLARREAPAAIVLALGLDGPGTLAQLRRAPQTRHVPAVMVGGGPQAGDLLPAAVAVAWLERDAGVARIVAGVRRAIAGAPRIPRVLVVEDDADLAHTLAETLSESAETYCALTGAEAIEQARVLLPDLIVLDVALPGDDGFRVVEALRTHNHLRAVPVVVYAAKDLSAEERELLKLGETRFLTKGRAAPQEVAETMRELLAAER